MNLGLKGKKAIVTGGSRGIGLATVKALASEGADVAFCARRQPHIDRALEECSGLEGKVTGSICDVSDLAALTNWLLTNAVELGGLDIVIANVSGGATPGDAGWQSAINTDLLGTVTTCEACMPLLAEAGGGAIVVVSSISGMEQSGGPSAYGTIKSGLISYAAQLSEIAAQQNVRVNSVSPGPIYVKDGFWGDTKRDNPDFYKMVEQRHGAGRLGDTSEVANAIAFLASPAASWVMGTNLKVDGGFTKGIQF